MLGYLAFQTGEDINELDLSGFGITFVAYTEGLASFPNGAAQAFSVVFFLMIITLGIDTQIGVMEAVLTFVKETRLGTSCLALCLRCSRVSWDSCFPCRAQRMRVSTG